MKSLRILLVMSELPLPFGHACGRWYYVLLKGLAERGHRVKAFVTCGKPEEIAYARRMFPAPHYDVRFYPFPARSGIRTKFETLKRPYSYTISPRLWDDLKTECDLGFDVLHLEGIWSGWLGQKCDPCKVVLNFHSLYDIDQANLPTKSLPEKLKRAIRRRAEHRLLRNYPTLLTITPRLSEGVRKIAPAASVHVVPFGLDTSLYPVVEAQRRSPEPVISVIGSMNWYPSNSAAVRLLTQLWPEIKRRVSSARVQIVGWNARSVLRKYLTEPGVEIIENVPDTRPYFERTSVLLYAPGRGSGVKVKVLEAFAYGIPVVTTSEGVEGIPAEDGIHAGVCDDDAGLIERTVGLLQDHSRQERQRAAARALLEAHCSPRGTLDALESVYSTITERAVL